MWQKPTCSSHHPLAATVHQALHTTLQSQATSSPSNHKWQMELLWDQLQTSPEDGGIILQWLDLRFWRGRTRFSTNCYRWDHTAVGPYLRIEMYESCDLPSTLLLIEKKLSLTLIQDSKDFCLNYISFHSGRYERRQQTLNPKQTHLWINSVF